LGRHFGEILSTSEVGPIMAFIAPSPLTITNQTIYNKSEQIKQFSTIKDKKKYLTPCYIDDVLPINNTNFANWIPLIDISR
jgi:hypothetical protein